MSSYSILMAFLGFSISNIMTLTKRDNVTSFPIWIPFSSCLIGLARTSDTILNWNGESEYPCLVPNLKLKLFSFITVNVMWAIGLLYMVLILLRYNATVHSFLRALIMWEYLIWSKAFSAFIEMSIWLLSFIFNVMCHIYWFIDIEPYFHLCNKPHLKK